MSKRRKWAIGCGGFAAFIAIASVVIMFVWADFPIAAMQLGAAEERARKAGVPLTQVELRQHFPFDPEQNSAPVYHLVFDEHSEAIRYVVDGMEDALASDGGGPEEALRVAARVAAPMAEIYRASKLRYYVHELDLDLLGFEVALIQNRYYSSFRQAALLLSARGQAHARLGRAEEAARDLGTARRLAGQVGQDPFLVAALVAVSVHSIAMAGMQQSAEALARDPEGLEVLEREVHSWPNKVLDFRKTLLGEAYFQITTTRNLASHAVLARGLAGPDPSTPQPATMSERDESQMLRSGRPRGLILQGSMTRILNGWAAFFEAVPEDGATPAQIEEGVQRTQQAIDDYRLSFLFARLIQEVLPQSKAAYLRPLANHRATLAYLDVLQFRNQHGRWPESLAEAGVEAVDPYDGQPLRYRVEGEGFRIWSVGPNKRDDNGVTRAEAQDSESFDLVALYPNPEIRTTPRARLPAEQRTPGAAPTSEAAPASP